MLSYNAEKFLGKKKGFQKPFYNLAHFFCSLRENFSNQKKQDSELELITSFYKKDQPTKQKKDQKNVLLEQMLDIYQVPEGKNNIKATKNCVWQLLVLCKT